MFYEGLKAVARFEKKNYYVGFVLFLLTKISIIDNRMEE